MLFNDEAFAQIPGQLAMSEPAPPKRGNLVQQAREWFATATVLEYEEQTYRPELVGRRSYIESCGATTYNCRCEGKPFRGSIPTRVRDVLSIDAERIRFDFGKGIATLRKV